MKKENPARIVLPILSVSWHGGVRVLLQIANYLDSKDFEVVIVVSRGRCSTPFNLSARLKIKHAGIHTGIKWIDYPIYLTCLPFYLRNRAICIANFFVTYYPVKLMALLTKVPYLYFVQDIESKYPGASGSILNWLCNRTYRDWNIVTANSFLKDRLYQEFGTESRSVGIGPGGVFYELPRKATKKYDLVYFLRREPWKGLDRFLRFLKIAEDSVSCICVSQDESLFGLVKRSSVHTCKPRDDEQLIECIDSAHLVFLTSYKEGFALPPLEGMARGLPTMLYPCGGPQQYIISGTNGLYVESEHEAVRVTKELLGDSARYAQMSLAAEATAKLYKMDDSLAAIAGFLSECGSWR